MGITAWDSLYGVLANMGATRIFPKHSKTVLTSYFGHLGYGVTAALVATKLGDEGLFQRGDTFLCEAKGTQALNEQNLSLPDTENFVYSSIVRKIGENLYKYLR